MASLFKPIKSFLTVVIFLVLIAVVTVVFNSRDAQQAKMEDNVIYQKSRLVLDTIWGAVQKTDGAVAVVTPQTTSAWSGLFNKIKEAWQASGSDSADLDVYTDDTLAANPSPIFIDKTATGSQLVLQSKSGKEYRINLPFKKN